MICFGEWGPLELRPISGVGLPRLTQTAFDPALLANRSATVRAAWAGNGYRKTRARGGADIW